MKPPVLLILATLGFVAASAGLLYLLAVYLPGATPLDIASDASVVSRLFLFIGVFLIPAGLVCGLSNVRPLALAVAALAVACAILGALSGELMVRMAIQASGTVRFEVTAPARAELFLLLSVGFLGAVAALGGLFLRRRHA